MKPQLPFEPQPVDTAMYETLCASGSCQCKNSCSPMSLPLPQRKTPSPQLIQKGLYSEASSGWWSQKAFGLQLTHGRITCNVQCAKRIIAYDVMLANNHITISPSKSLVLSTMRYVYFTFKSRLANYSDLNYIGDST